MISEAAVMTKPVRRLAPSRLPSISMLILRSARSFMSMARGHQMLAGSRLRSLPWKRCASMSAARRLCAEVMA